MSKSNEREALSGLADGAQPLAGPHTSRSAGTPGVNYALATLDGRHVTIKLVIAGRSVLVTGTATYEPGSGLCIALDDEARTEIHIAEQTWNGLITQDPHSGGDYLICLDAPAVAPQAAS
jgi:hypothetical protein